MEAVLLIDFGSTYTKVTAVDVQEPRLLGTATAHTTVTTDVYDGLTLALEKLYELTGPINFAKRLACSSAAGGLRMVACGLTPDLTAKAASLASLGAGAKVVGHYSYELTECDISEIDNISPDILLLTGGTDGGNKKCVEHNASMLANTSVDFPIVVAGNRNSGREVMSLLRNKQAYLCENVMPSIGVLNIEPARQKIQEIFLDRIVNAKGLSHKSELQDNILMPTPAAVLTAIELFATGCDDSHGIGNLIAVDVGGATTDVYSIAEGAPRGNNIVIKGLPEPFAKRTVEGDIGMRYSARGVIDVVGVRRVAEITGLSEEYVKKQLDYISENVDVLPQDDKQKAFDFALSALSVEIATLRHAGEVEEAYTPTGRVYVQSGKDLSNVGHLVLTGGSSIHSTRQPDLVKFAMHSDAQPQSLRPKNLELLVDKHQILAAMGLLAEYNHHASLKLMKKYITQL